MAYSIAARFSLQYDRIWSALINQNALAFSEERFENIDDILLPTKMTYFRFHKLIYMVKVQKCNVRAFAKMVKIQRTADKNTVYNKNPIHCLAFELFHCQRGTRQDGDTFHLF